MFMEFKRQVDQYNQDLINLIDSRVLFKRLSFVLFVPIVCGCFVLGHCLVLQYYVSLLVFQSSIWGRKSWLRYFCCVLNVISLL